VAPPAERVRADGVRAERFGALGAASGGRQIGQFWRKRLWRQKVGGTAVESRPVREGATSPCGRSSHSVHRRLLPHAVVVAALALAATTGSAHAAWTPPRTLASPAAEQLAAAGNAGGAELFAWKVTTERPVRTRTQTGPASYVRVRLRAASGSFNAARVISSTKELVANPAVALDAAGNATVVWTQAGRTIRVMGSHRRRGGQFGRPFEIGSTSAFNGARPAIAAAPDGTLVVVWSTGTAIRIARRPAGRCRSGRSRGCFETARSYARGTDHAIAMSRAGSAFVVWAATVRRDDAAGTALRLAIARRNRPFGSAQAIASPGDVSQPSIAIAPVGSAVIAWRGSPPTGGEQNLDGPILASIRASSGAISAPQTVSSLPGSIPRVGVNAQGEAILVWNQRDASPQNPDGAEVAASTRPIAGSERWAAPLRLSGPGLAAGSASLAIDSAGNAMVAYSSAPAVGHATQPVLLTQRRSPGAPFETPEPLGPDFTGASVFGAGSRITAVSGGSGGRTLVSDYVGG
jgi:hypothetical protein